MKTKKQDLLILILFPILALIISLVFKVNFLVSTLLFFLPLIIYLSHKNKKAVSKTAIFSLLFSIPVYIIGDTLATIGRSWYVPNTVFPWRLFGILPGENFIWVFCLIYSVVIFYEHFYDKTGREKIGPKMKYLVYLFGAITFLIFSFILVDRSLLYIPYAYFWIGLVFALTPAALVIYKFPKLLFKFLKTALYFFFLGLLLELTGLHLGQWTFPGEFIGWIELLGLSFPLEEFFFFLVLSTIAFLSYYEFFDDDRK